MIAVLNLFDIVPGKEKDYAAYLRRVQPVLDRHGAKVLMYGLTKMIHMGNCPQQYFGLVAYQTLDDLRSFSHDSDFVAIRPLRDNSTCNYVLTSIEAFPTVNHAADYLDGNGASAGQ